MTLKEKLIIKFTRIIPFVFLLFICVGGIETIYADYFNDCLELYNSNGEYLFTAYNTPISDFLSYMVYYIAMVMLLMFSFRMDFCRYHQFPIYFIIINFAAMQVIDYLIFNKYYVFHLYFISLFLTIITICISVYLYKHKNHCKR